MIDLHSETGRRWTTVALMAATLLSLAYWAEATLLRVRQGVPEAVLLAAGDTANAPGTASATVPRADVLARLLGAQAAARAAGPAERFKVMGVIASASGRGAALVAVDGQPPRAYTVGSELAPGFVLQSVSQSALTLTDKAGGAVLAVLPLPEPGATGAGGSSPGSSPGTGPGNGAEATGGPPAVGGTRSMPGATR